MITTNLRITLEYEKRLNTYSKDSAQKRDLRSQTFLSQQRLSNCECLFFLTLCIHLEMSLQNQPKSWTSHGTIQGSFLQV